MKHLPRLLVVLILALPPAATAGESVTLEGVLVDVQCFAVNKPKLTGKAQADRGLLSNCSPDAARAGVPVMVWDGRIADGELVTISAPAFLLAEHLSRPVRLRGELIAPRIVKPEKLEVKTPDGWVEVPTRAML